MFEALRKGAVVQDNEKPSPFGAKLKAAREAAGLTQSQLAARSGLHLGAVFKLEQGKREPSWETVQRLAAVLGVDCRAFVDPGLDYPAVREEDTPPAPRGRPRKYPAERAAVTPDPSTKKPRFRKGK